MHVLFIYPDILEQGDWTGNFYHGIAYLAAVVKQAGHSASLIHITRRMDRETFLAKVEEKICNHRDTLVAFSSTTNQFPFVVQFSRWAKEFCDCPVICGGIHATLNAEEVISVPAIDIVCQGEGEQPLVELCDRLEQGKRMDDIANLWCRSSGHVVKNPLRPVIRDLDTLPFPDRDIYEYPKLMLEKEGKAVFMASRGCPFDCTYCCNHALREIYSLNHTVRFRSPVNVIAELTQTKKRYPFIKGIWFDDDILPLKKTWFREFALAYAEKISLPFGCNIHPNLVDEQTVGLLKICGCVRIGLGIESGCDFIRNKVLNRPVTRQQIVSAFAMLREAGIRAYSYNIIGLPNETPSDMLETIKLNAAVKSDESQATMFFPYRGTRLHQVCRDHGLISERNVTDYFMDTTLAFGRLHRMRVRFLTYYFRVLVKLYILIESLPSRCARVTGYVLDRILCSRLFAIFVAWPLLNLYVYVRRNRHLAGAARKFKRSVLDG